MGEVKSHEPVLHLVAAFSRHGDSLLWSRDKLQNKWGPIALESPTFEFTETRFYDASMGTGLSKTFWAFEQLGTPEELVERKLQSNAWELEYAEQRKGPDTRPLNLDPGYLTEAKLVLATTKDRDHRIYLHNGIYAEVTLVYQKGTWNERPWTYPNYRRADYHQFFDRCRDYLRQRMGRPLRKPRDS